MREAAVDWHALRRRLAAAAEVSTGSHDAESARVHAILRERATALAKRRLHGARSRSSTNIVEFAVDGGRYALPLKSLTVVVPGRPLGVVPDGAVELAGILYARGGIWSIYDLRALLGLSRTNVPSRRFFVLMHDGDQRHIGLGVDEVPVVRSAEIQALNFADDQKSRNAEELVRGVTEDGLIVIDDDALWAHPAITEVR